MARMMRGLGVDAEIAEYIRLVSGPPVTRQLVTTTPYPVGQMYQPYGDTPSPVFTSGDTFTVTYAAGSLLSATDPADTGYGLITKADPYPCQLCWATARWPWEPLRSCPAGVDPESTLCERHRPGG